MGDTDDIAFTVDIFQKVLANEKHRLAVGAILRRYIHAQLAKGVEPDHYRMKWLHKGISRIVFGYPRTVSCWEASGYTEAFLSVIDAAQNGPPKP